jgi:DNA-binding transcriptional LysR family regulator
VWTFLEDVLCDRNRRHRIRPAGVEREVRDDLGHLARRDAGRVRLVVPRHAAMTVLAPKLGQFARDYPDVVLDVTTDDGRVNLVTAASTQAFISGVY